jgi:hypothetical protein
MRGEVDKQHAAPLCHPFRSFFNLQPNKGHLEEVEIYGLHFLLVGLVMFHGEIRRWASLPLWVGCSWHISMTHTPVRFYEQEPPAPLASSQSAQHRHGGKAKVIKKKKPSPKGWQTPL